jgi:hypothetical protein
MAQNDAAANQKCVVRERPDGTKYCATHGYPLEELSVSELAPIGEPNPAIDRSWRCPKGGTVILPRFK